MKACLRVDALETVAVEGIFGLHIALETKIVALTFHSLVRYRGSRPGSAYGLASIDGRELCVSSKESSLL